MNSRILTILIAIISVVGLILFGRVMGVNADDAAAVDGAVSPLVTFSLILLGATAVIALLASIFGVLKNPAALKKVFLGLAVLAVLFAVAYFLSPDNQVIGAEGNVLAEQGSTSKWVSTGIWYSVILGLIGGVFFVWDLIKGLIK
jgi:hypothetical protein